MEANVKKGTRCECSRLDHTSSPTDADKTCHAEAVRMVTLRAREVREGIQLSLCAACADFHEARQKAGAR